MTDDTDEWFPGGVILYNETHDRPRIRIITKEHVYEMQARKFHPVMQVFSLLIDGEFHASKYDSIERLMKLDAASKDGKCSEKERKMAKQNEELKQQVLSLTKEIEGLKKENCDLHMILGEDD